MGEGERQGFDRGGDISTMYTSETVGIGLE